MKIESLQLERLIFDGVFYTWMNTRPADPGDGDEFERWLRSVKADNLQKPLSKLTGAVKAVSDDELSRLGYKAEHSIYVLEKVLDIISKLDKSYYQDFAEYP